MFTGIVREQGFLADVEARANGLRLRVEAKETAGRTIVGDSVAVNGVCLTAVEVEDGTVAFDAVGETLARSAFADLARGQHVNLETALRAGDALGGHYVQGHVDAVGTVRSVAPDGEGARVWFDAAPEVLRYCVEKGSIAVDGVALTITALDAAGFEVALVPHTLAVTTLGAVEPGRRVNLEVDVLAKYVERLVASR